jgi:hypothetical protein
VNKSVTYSTVTSIPGEPSKCWITRNLGASQPASAVNDNTEPSAGWYWQFNRKQGFKHDGTTRTPNTIWITSIDENYNWLIANDPCSIELGNGWRIPTFTEWFNVDAIGDWANWDGPWNSGLKMHTAGYLNNNDGSVSYLGSQGNYWSNTQGSSTSGWNLYFINVDGRMANNYKAYGFSIRCIRDN